MLAYDHFSLNKNSVRSYDDNGFLHVSIAPVTREQVAPYKGKEIPDWQSRGLNAEKIYFGYRPSSELANVETVKSLNGIPIQFEHHVDYADNPATETRIGSTGTDANFDGEFLTNSLHFQNSDAIKRIEDGSMKELSLGYAYDPVFQKGEFKNEPYDFLMTNIRCNHVALVEEGRAGHKVCVGDAQIKDSILINQENDMEEKKAIDRAEEVLIKALTELHEPTKEENEIVNDGTKLDDVIARLQDAGLDLSKFDGDLKDVLVDAVKNEDVTTDDGEEVEKKDTEEVETDAEDDEKEIKEEDDLEVDAEDDDIEDEDFADGVEYGEEKEKQEPKKLDKEHEEKGEIGEDEEEETFTLTETQLKDLLKRTLLRKERAENAKHDALDECEKSLGKSKASAFDSAGDVYRHALKAEGLPYKSYSNREARTAYQMYMRGKGSHKSGFAQDAQIKTDKKKSLLNNILSNVTLGGY